MTEAELDAFREQICESATRIFAEKGYREVTMRAIAADMRCSPMKPYRYFESKEAIFDQIRRTTYRSLTEAAAHAIDGITDPAASLTAFGEVYIGLALGNPDVYRILFEVPQSKSGTASEISDEERKGWEQLCGIIQRAIDAGLLSGNSTTLAHMFWAAVHGLLSLHLAGKLRYGESLQSLVRPTITALIVGSPESARASPAASNEALQEKRSVRKRRTG